MGNINSASVADNDEAWDYSNLDCCVNPVIDPLSFQYSPNKDYNSTKTDTNQFEYGTPLPKSNASHPYLLYKNYCWIYLTTPDNKWATAGLFPRMQFKKLLKINPIYQIPNHPNYRLSELCREVINDTYKIYKILEQHGISVVDLVPFQYKYTYEEKTQSDRDLKNSLKSIVDNLDVVIEARKKCLDPMNPISPFLSHKTAQGFDSGIQFLQQFSAKQLIDESNAQPDPYSSVTGLQQKSLLQCIAERTRHENFDAIQSSLNFMKSYAPNEQWGLCRKRIFETTNNITQIIKNENWPCHFGDQDNAHQMYFNIYKPAFGSDRIAISIAPDTYSYVYMETALLRIGTRDFLDKHDYRDQQTKEWKTLEALIGELRRLVGIYNDS